MNHPTPALIATRLVEIYASTCPRKKAKAIRLTKKQFNSIAGRTKIEDAILNPTVRALRRHGIQLVRISDTFALLDDLTLATWLEPEKAAFRNAMKLRSAVTASAAETAVNPQAAWPFPTTATP
ncbi:MAG: hypothetical protein K0Q43_668 [Ramlibacter sp.]|jgi:hypothetical protein|nr:hypothetical protein [Ramlibacter sp.]